MAEYTTVAEERAAGSREERATSECPVCGGVVREPRSGDKWKCDDCARYWEEDEL